MKAKTIMLLESNVAVLSQLKEAIMEEKGYTVIFASDDGDEGIKQLKTMKPDLLLVGMFLKGTDGCGVIRAVKKSGADIKIAVRVPEWCDKYEGKTDKGYMYLDLCENKPVELDFTMERKAINTLSIKEKIAK